MKKQTYSCPYGVLSLSGTCKNQERAHPHSNSVKRRSRSTKLYLMFECVMLPTLLGISDFAGSTLDALCLETLYYLFIYLETL